MIVCAAVKIHLNKEDRDVVIHCLRHHYAFEIIRDLGMSIDDYDHTATEDGFIDNRGNFLTRTEAFEHARGCGQLCAQIEYDMLNHNRNELFSEDLW